MAAPFLVERGVEPAADEVGPALVMRLLLELATSVPRDFRRPAEHSGCQPSRRRPGPIITIPRHNSACEASRCAGSFTARPSGHPDVPAGTCLTRGARAERPRA